jgi:hypothetical protein
MSRVWTRWLADDLVVRIPRSIAQGTGVNLEKNTLEINSKGASLGPWISGRDHTYIHAGDQIRRVMWKGYKKILRESGAFEMVVGLPSGDQTSEVWNVENEEQTQGGHSLFCHRTLRHVTFTHLPQELGPRKPLSARDRPNVAQLGDLRGFMQAQPLAPSSPEPAIASSRIFSTQISRHSQKYILNVKTQLNRLDPHQHTSRSQSTPKYLAPQALPYENIHQPSGSTHI